MSLKLEYPPALPEPFSSRNEPSQGQSNYVTIARPQQKGGGQVEARNMKEVRNSKFLNAQQLIFLYTIRNLFSSIARSLVP